MSPSSSSSQPPMAILPTPIPLPNFTITRANAPSFNYFGTVNSDNLIDSGAAFLTNPNSSARELEDIKTTLNTFLLLTHMDCIGSAAEKAACWFTIRMSQPCDEYDVPRWHQDGRMYSYDEGKEDVVRSKYAVTLLGPPTLILPTDGDVQERLRKAEEEFLNTPSRQGSGDGKSTQQQRQEGEKKLRAWAAEEFKDVERVKLVKGQVVRFSWGRADSPIHSEPVFDSDRVFVSVLYGSENELRKMSKRRGKEYDG